MFKFVGQALWVVEAGAATVDAYAAWALKIVIQDLRRNTIHFEADVDTAYCEKVKCDIWIGPPPVREPLLTYARWYRRRIDVMESAGRPILYGHRVVEFDHPDHASSRLYLFDLYADDVLAQQREVLWIDITRVFPLGYPSSIIEAHL